MITSVEKVSKLKGISDKKTIFIVDNNVINRARLRNCIRACGKYMVIGEAQYCDYLQKISLVNPNILVLHSFRDVAKNEDLIKKIKQDYPLIKLFIIVDEIDENDFLCAIKAGVSSYFSCENSFEEIVAAIDDVIAYGASFDPKLNRFVFRVLNTMGENLHPCHFDKAPSEQFNLTKRELEVACVMSESSQYKDVAMKLHISNDTVKMHMSHIYRKLGVSTKHEAILKLQSKILEFKMNSAL